MNISHAIIDAITAKPQPACDLALLLSMDLPHVIHIVSDLHSKGLLRRGECVRGGQGRPYHVWHRTDKPYKPRKAAIRNRKAEALPKCALAEAWT